MVKNADPRLLAALGVHTRDDGRLAVPVAVHVPAAAVGAGAGMVSEFANTDLMGAYAGQGEDLSLGLERLRIGDIVALEDQDHRFGRGWRPGWLTIGVISTGHCRLFGHGPGPSSILSGPADAFALVDEPEANVRNAFAAMPQERTGMTTRRAPTVVATNLGGVVENPGTRQQPVPHRRDGRPYVPTGDGGIVLGVPPR